MIQKTGKILSISLMFLTLVQPVFASSNPAADLRRQQTKELKEKLRAVQNSQRELRRNQREEKRNFKKEYETRMRELRRQHDYALAYGNKIHAQMIKDEMNRTKMEHNLRFTQMFDSHIASRTAMSSQNQAVNTAQTVGQAVLEQAAKS